MDPLEQFEKRGAAQRRQRAQRQRAGLLRGRVVAISLIAFVVLWGVVFTQMATGNDPVLGSGVATSKAAERAKRERDGGGNGASRVAEEAIASTDPEESEPRSAEPEYEEPEREYVEPEYEEPAYEEPEYAEPEYEYVEPEPAPVTTEVS